MEYAVWNGVTYLASEVSKSFAFEEKIKLANKLKELKCPDKDCPNPVLRYCHGEVRGPYFAHVNHCDCVYHLFDGQNTQTIRNITQAIYDYFNSKGVYVQSEIKILPRHYTNLLFTMADGSRTAIEFGTQKTPVERVTSLSKQYENNGIKVQWIVISNRQKVVEENKTYFFKRFAINNNSKKDVLMINESGTSIMQYVMDEKTYLYKGKTYASKNYPNYYAKTGSLFDLAFDENGLTIRDFHERCQEWLDKKIRAFEKKIKQMDINEPNKIEGMQRDEDLRTKLLNADYYPDKRLCLHCGLIETPNKFDRYIFYKKKYQLGCCLECKKNKTPKTIL